MLMFLGLSMDASVIKDGNTGNIGNNRNIQYGGIYEKSKL